ncbi:MAG TPA: lysozyme inhibitor LprI family protein [Candidatus Acidoferrum sp.]|nr:lysozyme inhibitor LprI family protein [Candidatus Acidoferrum sp.]
MKTCFPRFTWVVFGFLLSSVPLVAQNHNKNLDPCKNNPNLTQADLNDCAGKDLSRAESRLEKLLRDLGISKDSPEQKAWETYRDAQLDALYPVKDRSSFGSVYPMCYAMLKTKLTLGRIRDLRELTGAGEGDVCSGYRSANGKQN